MLESLGTFIVRCSAAAAVLVGLAWLASTLWRSGSAAQKHLLLAIALIGSLLLPLGESYSPKVEVPLASLTPIESIGETLPAAVPALPTPATPPPAITPLAIGQGTLITPPPSPWRAKEIIALLWLTGVTLALLRSIFCAWRLHHLRQEAAAAPFAHHTLQTLCTEAGLSRPPAIGLHPAASVPMVFGIRHPMILLPPDAPQWDENCLPSVLRHEIAHLRRGDLVTRLLVQLALTLYWFHPILLLAAARLRKERERACDDLVVTRWGSEADYAGSLLAIVKARRHAIPAGAIGMAASHEVSGRIRRILAAAVNRVAPSRGMRLSLSIATLSLALLLGTLRFVAAKPEPTPPPTPTETFLLTVRNEAGHPVADAEVRLNGLRTDLQPGSAYLAPKSDHPILTGPDGTAAIPYPITTNDGLPVSGLSLHLIHPDYISVAAEVRMENPQPITLQAGIRTTLKARRTGSDQPVSDLWGDTGNGHDNYLVQWQRTGGMVAAHLRPPVSVRAISFDQDRTPLFSRPVAVQGAPGEEKPLELELTRFPDRQGRLSANVPRPIQNGKVIATVTTPSAVEGQPGHHWKAWTEVKEDGTFTFKALPEGTLYLVALCEGYVSLSADREMGGSLKAQTFPDPSQPLEIAMEATATAEITLLSPEGKPVEGAEVAFWPNQRLEESSSILGTLHSSAAYLLGRAAPRPAPQYEAITDKQGRATVKHLPSGKARWSASSRELELPMLLFHGQPQRTAQIELESGKTTRRTFQLEERTLERDREILEQANAGTLEPYTLPYGSLEALSGAPLPVEPGEALSGEVRDTTGKPLAGVSITAGHQRQVTQADGHFHFPTKGERYLDLHLQKEGLSPIHIVQQPAGKLREPITLSNLTFFEGTVVDQQGEPLRNHPLRAYTGVKTAGNRHFIPPIAYETRTDAHGRYRLAVHPDRYEILVRADALGGRRTRSHAITSNQNRKLDLTLEPGATFTARLIDSETKTPIPHAKATLHDGRLHALAPLEGVSDAHGIVSWPNVVPGEYSLGIEAEGYGRRWSEQAPSSTDRQPFRRSDFHFSVQPLRFSLSKEGNSVTVVMEKEVALRGIVTDPDGKPIGEAMVYAVPSHSKQALPLTTRSAADGTFAFQLPASHDQPIQLMARDQRLDASQHWGEGSTAPMTLRPGERREGVEIRLSRPARP